MGATPHFVRGDKKMGFGGTEKRLAVTENRGSGDQKVGSGRQKEGSKCIIELFEFRKQKNTK